MGFKYAAFKPNILQIAIAGESDGSFYRASLACTARNDDHKMMKPILHLVLLTVAVFTTLTAAGPTNDGQPPAAAPARNTADEPLADEFSQEEALAFTDNAARHWQESRGCITCHTNGVYLVTRAEIDTESVAYLETRAFARDYLRPYLEESRKPRGQHGAIEGMVATTAFLAISDMKTTGELDEITTAALNNLWKTQDPKGHWPKWLKCNWGPYESDDHFGPSLVAVAAGLLPDEYRKQSQAAAGIERLRKYLKQTIPTNAHQKAMLLWANANMNDLIDESLQKQWIEDILELQHEDGGWALIDLGDDSWKREDDKKQDAHSDGYATGFIIFTLRKSGLPANHRALEQGAVWLKANQRKSGRWFTRSPRRDRHHFISQAGTNFAAAAIHLMDHPND